MATMTLASRPTPVRAAAHRPVRLTRRGRLVVGFASAVLTAAAVLGVLGLGSPQATAADSGSVVSHVVRPGESLWSVAAQAAGTGDVGALVHEIRRINGLGSSTLTPGQVLLVPSR